MRLENCAGQELSDFPGLNESFTRGMSDNLANPGLNMVTFEPNLALTYLFPPGFSLSLKFRYAFNTDNRDTGTDQGDEFGVDYALRFSFHTRMTAGVTGYYCQQVTDDRADSRRIKDWPGQGICRRTWEYDQGAGREAVFRVPAPVRV